MIVELACSRCIIMLHWFISWGVCFLFCEVMPSHEMDISCNVVVILTCCLHRVNVTYSMGEVVSCPSA
jgi:hypothetical protein